MEIFSAQALLERSAPASRIKRWRAGIVNAVSISTKSGNFDI